MARKILAEATPEQWVQGRKNSLSHWGPGLTEEQYLMGSRLGVTMPFGSEGRQKRWVLVPADDPTTLDFYASCETYLRPIFFSDAAGHVQDAYCEAVAAVFTPLKHRKQGNANEMMTALHEKFKTEDGVLLSILFSAVGDFYTKCGQGWLPHYAISTTWTCEDISNAQNATTAVTSKFISSTDIHEICRYDAALLRDELVKAKPDKPKNLFALVPTGREVDWQIARAVMHASVMRPTAKQPTIWGVEFGERGNADWSFALFVPNYSRISLQILRLRCISSDVFVEILKHANTIAQEQDLTHIQVWNAPQAIVNGLPDPLNRPSITQDSQIPSVALYTKEKVDLEWVANEKINYC